MNTHRFNADKLRNTKMFKDFEGEIWRNVADDIERSPRVLL